MPIKSESSLKFKQALPGRERPTRSGNVGTWWDMYMFGKIPSRTPSTNSSYSTQSSENLTKQVLRCAKQASYVQDCSSLNLQLSDILCECNTGSVATFALYFQLVWRSSCTTPRHVPMKNMVLLPVKTGGLFLSLVSHLFEHILYVYIDIFILHIYIIWCSVNYVYYVCCMQTICKSYKHHMCSICKI